jgi:tetratricopeptide (TPR) repeat protein
MLTQKLFSLAISHHQHGRLQAAITLYDQVLALEPGNVNALTNRATALSLLGRHTEALSSYEKAIGLKANNDVTYFGHGNALNALGRYEEALASYQQATLLNPDYFEAYNNLGGVLKKLNRCAEALASYDRCLLLKPNEAELHCNRADVLIELNRYGEALVSYDQSITLKPAYFQAYHGRGIALSKLGRDDEALTSFDRAIALKPDYVSAYHNRGHILHKSGCMEKSLISYEQAIALNPQYAPAQYGKALLQLQLGNYADGFALHEWRLRGGGVIPRKPRELTLTPPRWRGEDALNKTILLHDEQGLGDSIQMLRYLPLVKAKVAHIILELRKSLLPLLGPLADGVTVMEIERNCVLPPFDLHCPLMSLPFALGTVLDTIPAQVPYLTAPVERLPWWRARLPKSTKPRVGVVWSTSGNTHLRNRGIDLESLAPLLSLEGFAFVSLQVAYRDQDLPLLEQLPIERIDDAIADFGDTAAAIEQCDLVISVDTSVAHLAGALGKPLWLLLPFVADWRWLLDRNDSPWYPSARLFRQGTRGDWDAVIATVVEELVATGDH